MASPLPTLAGEEVVVVTLGAKAFAFPISAVREVLPLSEPAPVPGWPDVALGVVELRGELLPLIDAAPALGLPPSPLSAARQVVVVRARERDWALLVDRVEGVRVAAEVRPVAGLGLDILGASAVCIGMIPEPSGTIALVNVEALMGALRLPLAEGEADGR